MNRFVKICLMIGGALLALGLILGGAAWLLGAFGDITGADASALPQETVDIPTEGLTRLEITLTSEDVRLRPAPDDALRIAYTPVEGVEYRYTRASQDTARFTAGGKDRGFFGFSFVRRYGPVTVYLPRALDLTVSTVSGDIQLEDRSVGALRLSTTSGNITLSELTAEQDVVLSTTSGDVTVTGAVLSGSLQAASTSGELQLSQVEMERLSLNTTSGDLSLRELTVQGTMDTESVSGDLSMTGTVEGDISATATSGNVTIQLVASPPHRVSLSTRSGYTSVLGGDDAAERTIHVNTTSGNIYIQA